MNHVSTLTPPFSIIRPLIFKLNFNLKILGILSLLTLISLLVFYIFQTNSVVSESYLFQNYQEKLNKMTQENEALEISSTQVNSWGSIESKIKELDFEKVGKVYYIRILENQIVTK